MNQVAAARAIGLSASYYNQLENDERPLTVPVLLKVAATFGVDVQVPPKIVPALNPFLRPIPRSGGWSCCHDSAAAVEAGRPPHGGARSSSGPLARGVVPRALRTGEERPRLEA